MDEKEFINKLNHSPESIEFDETIKVIETNYQYIPTYFKNGDLSNGSGENEGSCKIFAFALINNLTAEAALACFGRYYRNDVLKNPQGSNHQNIRQFMLHGWTGIHFDTPALIQKNNNAGKVSS